MLLILLDYLQGFGFVVPSVFFNASTRMILAAITSLLITIHVIKGFVIINLFLKSFLRRTQ